MSVVESENRISRNGIRVSRPYMIVSEGFRYILGI
jgi:hypothetical protein